MTAAAVGAGVADVLTDLAPGWLLPKGLPGWPMALAMGIAVAVLVGVLLGPRMGVARFRLGLWLAAILFSTAFTWTVPAGVDRLPGVWQFCEVGALPWPTVLATGLNREVLSNVILLVPAGAAAVLWPLGAKRLTALLVALAVSPAIETVQLIPALHRGCQVADVVNNSIGVLAGFALAAAVESVVVSLTLIAGPASLGRESAWSGSVRFRGPTRPSTSQVSGSGSSGGVRIRGRDA